MLFDGGSGPAADAPSRLQRFIVGAPTWVSSLAFGLVLGGGATFAFAVATATHPDAAPVAVIAGAVSIPGSALAMHLMRDDRGLTRSERLAREVPYIPTLGVILWENRYWLVGCAALLGVILVL